MGHCLGVVGSEEASNTTIAAETVTESIEDESVAGEVVRHTKRRLVMDAAGGSKPKKFGFYDVSIIF